MTATLEYALMAGASYRDTRPDINKFPIPAGWTMVSRYPQDNTSGFEAATFGNGTTLSTSTEIVISYAGTKDALDVGDNQANVGLATGLGSVQLLQAAEYYLQVKAANPGATITFTGHSLGGGLAALMGVFFGVRAVTFDQAPFANTAEQGLLGTASYALDLKNYLIGKGYTEAELADLTSFLQVQQNIGGIPNSNLITNICVQGEFLSTAPLTVFDRIGTTVKEITNSSNGVSGFDLHAQSLLTVFLQSGQTAATGKTLNDVTFKLNDLLKMIFDPNLFYYDPNNKDKPKENFLEHLVRHQTGGVDGVQIGGDAMVTRFTSDLWKLAQDGGLTMSDGNPTNAGLHELSDALIAFAMQKYYEENLPAGAAPAELFTGITGGIRFDIASVSRKIADAIQSHNQVNLNDAKGYAQYFVNYLKQDSLFTVEERAMIQSLLPYMRDWYVQAGASGMNATDTLNRGAFMLGGTGSDTLVGDTAADLLVGNAGNDLLQGRGGNDTLLGGAGNDTYVYTSGGNNADGLVIILDTSGQNSIVMDGATLAGGNQYGDDRVYRDANGHLYVQANPNTLVIDGDIVIQNYAGGNSFGLNMTGPVAESGPVTYAGNGSDNYIGMGVFNRNPNDSSVFKSSFVTSSAVYADDGYIGIEGSAIYGGHNFDSIVEGGLGSDIICGRAGNAANDSDWRAVA